MSLRLSMLTLTSGKKVLSFGTSTRNYTLCFRLQKNVWKPPHITDVLTYNDSSRTMYVDSYEKKKEPKTVELVSSDKMALHQHDRLIDVSAYVCMQKNAYYGMRVSSFEDFMVEQSRNDCGVVMPYQIMDDMGDEIICKSLLLDAEVVHLLYKQIG
jgi:hypothetical protein